VPRFFDVLRSEDLSRKVRFNDVLQPGHFRVIEKTAAGANVGIDETRVGGILPPVREFIAVRIEDRIEAKGLDRDLLFGSVYPRSEAAKRGHS
jgi:hypothetical protein